MRFNFPFFFLTVRYFFFSRKRVCKSCSPINYILFKLKVMHIWCFWIFPYRIYSSQIKFKYLHWNMKCPLGKLHWTHTYIQTHIHVYLTYIECNIFFLPYLSTMQICYIQGKCNLKILVNIVNFSGFEVVTYYPEICCNFGVPHSMVIAYLYTTHSHSIIE